MNTNLLLIKMSFPGFEDVSPEELRLEAYEAEKSGNIQLYVGVH